MVFLFLSSEKGRRLETNFRENANGEGVQPLFKSNILNYGGNKDEFQEFGKSEGVKGQDTAR